MDCSTAVTPQAQIEIRDYDASNKAVPDVWAELLRYCGFVMVFFTDTDGDGNPQTSLKIVRKDALSTQAPKPLFLAANGASSLDLASNNTTALHLARDCNELVNQWTMETAIKQVEVTVYLAPGFEPVSGDDSSSNVTKWYSSNLTDATDISHRKYRWFIADECADGHWNFQDSTWVTDQSLDLTAVFPNDDEGYYTYCDRYRPGSRTLISKDAEGKPLKAVLELCTNAKWGDPYVMTEADDRTWTTVTKGWRLLDDRLGIEVTIEDPNSWETGQKQSKGGGAAAVPTIRAVTWSCNPQPSSNKAILLRLTTVIEADQRIGVPNTDTADAVTAKKRKASPTKFARERLGRWQRPFSTLRDISRQPVLRHSDRCQWRSLRRDQSACHTRRHRRRPDPRRAAPVSP